MNQERAKRKLSGILSADAVGYSRLMQEDEVSTIRALEKSKRLMSKLIQQYKGRVVDSPGDNLLAEFSSVVDATECAVKIQQELKTRNADLPGNRRMDFRIGINLGDVVEEDDRIYGDGVNIAARIEGLAEPGGVCISRTAYDHIKNKLELGYEYLGEHSVKNIAEPVRVYRVLMEPDAAGKVIGEKRFLGRVSRRTAVAVIIVLIVVAGGLAGWNFYLSQSKRVEPASLSRMAFLLPHKPSIAVLPFVNMSEDPKQEYFTDGITEEVITALSKVPELFVIARNSTFTYKGKSLKIQQVAEELGVQYVLEGSVRRAGDKVRITAQLVDTITGNHLWAERYDRQLKEIFALQDEITLKILAALQVKLTIGEQARTMAKGTDDLEAYLKILQGRALGVDFKIENVPLMRQLAEEAISLDPKYSNAYKLLGGSYIQEVWWGLTKTPGKSLERAYEFYQKALALDENNAGAHSRLANVYNLKRQFDVAITEIEQAISLNPNDADIHANLGRFLHNLGRTEESVSAYKMAMRLNPHAPSWYLYNFGVTYWMMGQHEKAIALCKKAIERNPDQMFAHMALAAAYSEFGRDEEARASAAEALRIKPKLNLEWFEKMLPWKNKADVDRIVDALRKAGIPDKPPQ